MGNKVAVDSANKVLYLLATGTTYFNQGKAVAGILPLSSSSPLWGLLAAPPSAQADLAFTDADTLYNLIDFTSKKPVTTAPVAWVGVIAAPAPAQTRIVTGSSKMGTQLLAFDGKTFTPLASVTAPARETSFGENLLIFRESVSVAVGRGGEHRESEGGRRWPLRLHRRSPRAARGPNPPASRP